MQYKFAFAHCLHSPKVN